MVKEPDSNEPSDLDEMTHSELRLMHEGATAAILFAKMIQWWTVGICFFVFGAIIITSASTSVGKLFANQFAVLTILLSCGAIFVLVMYQFWQFNEIRRIIAIEKHFSSFYKKIRNLSSRREGNVERYTLLAFMIIVVIIGASFAISAIKLIK